MMTRAAIILTGIAVVVLFLTGCTTILYDPETGGFRYESGRDIEASGLLIIVEYYPDGTKKLIHIEAGNVSGKSSEIVASVSEGVTAGVIEGLRIGAGIP